MRKVVINEHEVLLDDTATTFGLTVDVDTRGYAKLRYIVGKHKARIYARILLNAPDHLQVDHINGNSLDNRKENLRLVTPQQNSFNSKGRSKLGLPKGVSNNGERYIARITAEGITYNLGTYLTIEKAETAYKKAAEKLQGEYAVHINRKL